MTPPPHSYMADALSIRNARETDLDVVLEIAQQASTAAHWSRPTYTAMLSPHAQPHRTFLLAERDGNIVGFAVALSLSSGSRPFDCELETIAVAFSALRTGVGTALLESLFQRLRALGAPELRAEVRPSNLAARGLYASAGFVETGRRPGYYSAPEEDALLLVLQLGSVPEDFHIRAGP